MKANELIQVEAAGDLAFVTDAELFRDEKGWTETPVQPVQTAEGVIVAKVRCKSEANYNDALDWAVANECCYNFLAQELEAK